jgi:hypothetical protein
VLRECLLLLRRVYHLSECTRSQYYPRISPSEPPHRARAIYHASKRYERQAAAPCIAPPSCIASRANSSMYHAPFTWHTLHTPCCLPSCRWPHHPLHTLPPLPRLPLPSPPLPLPLQRQAADDEYEQEKKLIEEEKKAKQGEEMLQVLADVYNY